MKLITVSTGIAKGKTSTMYRLGAAEYKDGNRVLIIHEEQIRSLAEFMPEVREFVEATEFAITLPCLNFHNLAVSNDLIKYFEAHILSKRFDLILVDGIYNTDYLQYIKPLLKDEESTVIMTVNADV